jgi:hypothetical protein
MFDTADRPLNGYVTSTAQWQAVRRETETDRDSSLKQKKKVND